MLWEPCEETFYPEFLSLGAVEARAQESYPVVRFVQSGPRRIIVQSMP
jgi:hypothetical protein